MNTREVEPRARSVRAAAPHHETPHHETPHDPEHGYGGILAGAIGAVIVAAPMAVLWFTRTSAVRDWEFASMGVHAGVVALATVLGAAITVISARGLQRDPSAFRLYVTLAFFVETYIYALHGVFTHLWERFPALFLLYGPASRLAFALCLGVAVYRLAGRSKVSALRRHVWTVVAASTALALVIAVYATSPLPASAGGLDRVGLELLALAAMAGTFTLLLNSVWWRYALLRYLLGALVLFSLSSIGFLLVGRPFDATFWASHLIFAAGFLILGFGILSVRTRTERFGNVFEVASLDSELRDRQARSTYYDQLRSVVGAIAHHQNNLMTVILSSLEEHDAVGSPIDAPERVRRERARVATARTKELSRRLLVHAGDAPMVLAWTNLPAAFREAAERWQQRSGRTIVIEDKLDAGSAFIDPAYLADALAALLDNAADATPDGDTIRLSAACRERENGKVEARLSVVDDGVGMDPQDLQQAKELFYTTHDTNRRMGLGLPFVAGVVEAFSGRLELSSEPGRGFQATIVLECRRDARGDRPPSEKRAPGRVES